MSLSDLSIRRPVFATVISLILMVLGIIAFTRLPLRELPDIDAPVVSIDTGYTGASAAVVESRVTQLLEDAVSGIEGVDLLQSNSRNGRSSITIEFNQSREIESAANDVRDAVSRVVDRLPEEADAPQVSKQSADADVIMWLNFTSPKRGTLELTDYAERYLVDRFSSLPGVAQVRIAGGQRYALRITVNAKALAARNLTVTDIENALRRENVELPAGRLESQTRDFILRVSRAYEGPADFQDLVLSSKGNERVLLRDVAVVAKESSERRAWFRGNGQLQVGLGIIKTSTSNALDVSNEVKAQVEEINKRLPVDMKMGLTYDSTVFIDDAVKQVYKTLFEAIVLVLLVIWLFLGSARSALVPAVTVPVCLIAAFIGLWIFGYSINLLTLLALILAIGLVVDDAIVVLENCQRRVDLGEPALLAAQRGTKQVAFAVIATTAVLVAVFVPVAFIDGANGRLFRELAVALAGAIVLSAFVALSLTPMMCSIILKPHDKENTRGFAAWIDRKLNNVSQGYGKTLARIVEHPWLIVIAMLTTIVIAFGLSNFVQRELSPTEDRGAFFISVTGPEGAGFDYTVTQLQQIEKKILAVSGDKGPVMRINARVPGGFGASEEMHTGQAIVILKPWKERDVDTQTVVEQMRKSMNDIPGVVARPQVRSGLTRGGGGGLQIVLGGPDYDEIVQWRDLLLKKMEENPKLLGADSDYKETRPQLRLDINRQRAADLGVSVQSIGSTLESMMGSRKVTTFVEKGEEYDVIVQAQASDRATPDDLKNLTVRSSNGTLVPMTSLVTVHELAEPGSYGRFNRLRAITVSANLAPGYTMGEAITWMDAAVKQTLPDTAQIDFKGEAREYLQSGSALFFTFMMALLIVYLVLAAQFESFLHPLVIMLTVPLAVFGAVLGLWLTGKTFNLFSTIGIVMLVGLAAKNGILIVEFANQRRDAGLAIRDAILEASATRLRPILMTSIATVVGALPLVFDGGPGSGSRSSIGVVVVFGVAISTFFTLFVIPTIYRWSARFTTPPDQRGEELDALGAKMRDIEAKH
ncbi:MAG TPA: efflux RND transporter permease subunit [Arenimonas sp.]|nr:efflux RND transporter permease subunit [Arenimonas sp.]HOZ03905.1 efflux RND transporter permease subunit [Arenimonas sp.]